MDVARARWFVEHATETVSEYERALERLRTDMRSLDAAIFDVDRRLETFLRAVPHKENEVVEVKRDLDALRDHLIRVSQKRVSVIRGRRRRWFAPQRAEDTMQRGTLEPDPNRLWCFDVIADGGRSNWTECYGDPDEAEEERAVALAYDPVDEVSTIRTTTDTQGT